MNNSIIPNNIECRYCHEVGHAIRNCSRLKNKKTNNSFPIQRNKQSKEYISKLKVTNELINQDDFPVMVSQLTTKADDKMNGWYKSKSFADAIKTPVKTIKEAAHKDTDDIVFETL